MRSAHPLSLPAPRAAMDRHFCHVHRGPGRIAGCTPREERIDAHRVVQDEDSSPLVVLELRASTVGKRSCGHLRVLLNSALVGIPPSCCVVPIHRILVEVGHPPNWGRGAWSPSHRVTSQIGSYWRQLQWLRLIPALLKGNEWPGRPGSLRLRDRGFGILQGRGNGLRPVFKGWLTVGCLHSCLLDPLSSHLLKESRRCEPWLIDLLKARSKFRLKALEVLRPEGSG